MWVWLKLKLTSKGEHTKNRLHGIFCKFFMQSPKRYLNGQNVVTFLPKHPKWDQNLQFTWPKRDYEHPSHFYMRVPRVFHFISLYTADGIGHLSFPFTGAFSTFQGLHQIIFRPQALGWPEIVWSSALSWMNLMRWVIFDSLSFICLFQIIGTLRK